MRLDEYLNSIKDKKIAVLGIGISNLPLIRLLASEGINVTACDKRSFEDLGMDALELLNLGVKLKLGESYLDNLDYDIVFRTPSLMPFDISTRGVLTSEMELFMSLCPCRMIAVTGSDGKTTTSSIIAELLSNSGYTVHLGGNIGKPLLCELPFIKKDDIAVLELSSFQLHSIVCSPDIAVFLNITPNHLDKHKDFQDYVDAKKNIFLHQKEDGVLVLNADDDLVSTFGGNRFFSTGKEVEGCYSIDGKIYRDNKFLMHADDIFLPGNHNLANFTAAFSATIGLVDDETCIKVAKEFKGVKHRMEFVRQIDGVTYINDSIGSSPTRTIAGIHALKEKPIVILGGYDKNISFDDLGREIVSGAKAAVLTGATADKIEQAINAAGEITYYKKYDFDEAFKTASLIAEKGDTVLLSPACASFDRFKNFEVRGDYFKKLVWEL